MSAPIGREHAMQIVSNLEEVARIDTIYRDLYLRRARGLLTPVLAEGEYRRCRKEGEAIDDLLRQLRSTLARHEWSRVQSLADQIRVRRQALDRNRAELDLATRVYDARDVPLAPFAPGLPGLTGRSARALAELKDRVVTALASLERDDPGFGGFYADRRSCLEALPLTMADPVEVATAVDSSALEVAAARALDRGDMDQLERLAQRMLATRAGPTTKTAVYLPVGPGVDLAQPFSEEEQRRARRMGLRAARVEFDAECAEYLQCCCVWLPSLPAGPLSLDTKVSHGCTCGHVCPPGIAASLKDTLDLLIVHPFVSSAGERYLPRFAAETVLVEDFPEGEDRPEVGELAKTLGLGRRTGISREELEALLLRRGAEIVQDVLGLEPRDFRLVCIPFDIYSRLAPSLGWGRQTHWTHFDGYQIWKAGRLRALVGGDVRYGGRHHICSIGCDDEREEVVVRLAVVRRERFVVTGGGPGDLTS